MDQEYRGSRTQGKVQKNKGFIQPREGKKRLANQGAVQKDGLKEI